MNTQTQACSHYKKHPSGLPVLFLTELWERFGFYTLQGLLVLYLTSDLGFSDNKSNSISAAFLAFVYISPLIGGYLADKVLGFRNAIFIGGVFLAVGYALMTIANEAVLYLALAMVIVGNGYLKPNISSLLGTLYGNDRAHRDAGFTIFYIGINVGTILGTIVAGLLQKYSGWGAAFTAASVGLIIGLMTFALGMRSLQGHGVLPDQKFNQPFMRLLHHPLSIIFGTIAAIFLVDFLLRDIVLTHWLLILFGCAALVFFTFIASQQKKKLLRDRMFALIILIVISVVFWGLFFQLFMSVNLFIDRLVNRNIFGFEIPPIFFIGLESIFIILLGPVLAHLWKYLDRRKLNPSLPSKFSLAIFLIGLAFFILALSAYFADSGFLISPLWIVLAYLVLTTGELFLSPIGMSAVTVLSPPEYVGIMMGGWFLALGFGGELAGVIANIASLPATNIDKSLAAHLYSLAFFKAAVVAFVTAAALAMLTKAIKKLIKPEQNITPPIQ